MTRDTYTHVMHVLKLKKCFISNCVHELRTKYEILGKYVHELEMKVQFLGNIIFAQLTMFGLLLTRDM